MTGKPSSACDYSGTCSRKGRGMAQRSLDLIEAMRDIAEAAQPITGRGVGYKLFTRGLIASMARSEMARVYRLLLIAREQGIIPWDWIVDETRDIRAGVDMGRSRASTPAASPAPIAATSGTSSRSGSRSGARKAPCAACSRRCSTTTPSASVSMHGFSSGTVVHDIAEDDDGRDADRALCRRLRSVRHVHVGGGSARRASPSTAATTSR